MAIDMSQFYQVFFEESAEHLAAMETLLLELNVADPDPEELNAIFRAAHSIKGSAGTFGFNDLAGTTHILENLLDRIRKQELRLTPEMVDAFLASGDLLHGMLDAHQGRGEVDMAEVAAMTERLRQLSAREDAPEPSPSPSPSPSSPELTEASSAVADDPATPQRVFEIEFVPTEASAKGGGVANLVAELGGYGELEILSQPASGMHEVALWRLRLRTPAEASVFSEQVDFVAESGAWRVIEQGVATPEDDSFGLFEPLPDEAAQVKTAYGFFSDQDEVPAAAALPLVAGSDQEAAYGFFEPLPVAPAPAGQPAGAMEQPAEAYGLFEPVGPVEAVRPAVTEDAGYGFFETVVSAPAAEAPPAKVEHATPIGLPAPDKTASGADAQAARTARGSSAGDSSIRVSVEKVDQLINLVGELVITQAMLLQTMATMQDRVPERLVAGLTQLERNTRDLQESVMSIRMMPISFVFSRFPRVVRDLSAKLGKRVELRTSGETTELDKGLIEKIADPLTHLIRNSLDHGIESPEKRIAAGKGPVGTITLKAYQQGGNIVVEVGDDGAGLQRNKILAKARERGLQVSEQMTDQDVFNLIFEAGFSTADQVTDVSGRGVGMDVVRRNIQSMGGRVEIDSMAGVGTRMTVRLPLTLAILDGMSIAVGDQTYILPLSYVLESLQPKAGEIKTLSNQARVIQVRGEYLPVVVLHEMFSLAPRWDGLTQGIMVVIDADGVKAALFVDALLGQHQVVIKSLEANYRRIPGISGATIMGDGHVALILDVSAIASMVRTHVLHPA